MLLSEPDAYAAGGPVLAWPKGNEFFRLPAGHTLVDLSPCCSEWGL